jgi:hypothetical protein
MRNSSTRRLGAVTLATLLALVFSFASPALAGAKGGTKADRGERPSVSGSTDDDSAPDTDPTDADADNRHPSGNDRHEDKGTQGKSTSTPDQNGSGPERDYEGTDKPFVSGDGSGGIDKEDQDGNNGCGNDDDFEDDNEGWCGNKPKTDRTNPPVVDDEDDVKCPKGQMPTSNGKDCKPKCTATMPSGSTSDHECDDDECTATMPSGSTSDDECDHDAPVVLGEDTTKCPKAGETLPAGTTMPAGCTTPTPGATVTSDSVTPAAVLGTELTAAPAAEQATVLGVQFERVTPAAVAAAAAAGPAATGVLGAAALARTGLSSFTMLALAIALGLLAVGFLLKRAGRTTSDL